MRWFLVLLLLLGGCAVTPQIKQVWTPDYGWWINPSPLRSNDGGTRQVSPQGARNLHAAFVEMQHVSKVEGYMALIDFPAINAFNDNGLIYVSLDLVNVLGNDYDALAAILSHEMAHSYFKHTATNPEIERAADVQSLRWMLQAKRDPCGMARVVRAMERDRPFWAKPKQHDSLESRVALASSAARRAC